MKFVMLLHFYLDQSQLLSLPCPPQPRPLQWPRFPQQNARSGRLSAVSLDDFAGLSHQQTLRPALHSQGFERQTRKRSPLRLWLGKSYSLALLGLTGFSSFAPSYGCLHGLYGLPLRFLKTLVSYLNPFPFTHISYLGKA